MNISFLQIDLSGISTIFEQFVDVFNPITDFHRSFVTDLAFIMIIGAIRSAFTLAAPRGEFSIVIIKTGVDIGAVSAFLFPLIGVISIVTTFITPFMVRASDKVIPIFEKKNV